jgi:hypothetical protein
MRGWVLAGAILLLSCSSIEQFPRPACLYDASRHYRVGKVLLRREDGARLFQFRDPSQGDHGFMWIEDGDASHTISVCREATLMDREPSEAPPQ